MSPAPSGAQYSVAHKWAINLEGTCIYKHVVPNGTPDLLFLTMRARWVLLSASWGLFLQNPPVNRRAKLSTCVKPIIVCSFFRVFPGTTT